MKRTLIFGIILFPLCGISAQTLSQAQKPFSRVELLALQLADEREDRIERDLAQRGIDFQPTEDYVDALKASGAGDALIDAIRKAPARPPVAAGNSLSPGSSAAAGSTNGGIETQENEVLRHLFQAAKRRQEKAWQEVEKELRAALAIDPKNPDLHVDLARVLPTSQGESGWDEAIVEDREALRLEPDLTAAHHDLALGLARKHDISGAIIEDREVVRLDPNDALACSQLGQLLEGSGDLDGAIAAYNEAVRRAPDEGYFHYELAKSSEKKGDLDAAIVQAREATRIGPDNFIWHRDLAKMLRSKGDEDAAAKEMQIANALQPRNMPKRIRVGGRVISAKLVHQVRPKYPVEAKMDHIEGTVRLDVVLNPDGTVQSLKVLSGDPTLAQAAQKAVSQWRYQPTLLNGDAVEVATEIDVNFELAKR